MILLSESPPRSPRTAAAPPFGTLAGPAGASAEAADPLSALRVRFLADFTDGRVGQHHNTVQHRERILRQLAQAQGG